MSDLLEFIKARLAADEVVARAATSGPWQTTPNRSVVTANESPRRIVASVAALELWPTHEDAAHIARHDPARVLREVEGKRCLLGLAETLLRFEASYPNPYYVGFGESMLRAVAVAWADHDDYSEGWAP